MNEKRQRHAYKIISPIVVFYKYVNQCRFSLLTLSLFTYILYIYSNGLLPLLFLHRFFAAVVVVIVAKIEANSNVLYFSNMKQRADEFNEQCEMTHTCPTVHP